MVNPSGGLAASRPYRYNLKKLGSHFRLTLPRTPGDGPHQVEQTRTMRMLFAAAPSYGLMLPVIPLIWAARAAGHEVALATTSSMTEVAVESGLSVIDVFPDREPWAALAGWGRRRDELAPDAPAEVVAATGIPAPFPMFTALMTEGTIAAAQSFEPDVLITTGDHPAGLLAAGLLRLPVLEVGNRVSWSTRDAGWRDRMGQLVPPAVLDPLRVRLGIPADPPDVIARIDPRAPSLGGLPDHADQPDSVDGRPWWSMQYVPYNGGATVPDWALHRGERPRVGVTLGTVVPMISGTTSLAVVIEALAALDVEVVLASGSADLSDLGQLPANVRSVGYLPLSTFLPSCSLLIHHGGSGTTAAPLFYGIPQLVLPSFADNPLSAQRVVDGGVGLQHDPKIIDGPIIRSLVGRLLDEPQFAASAARVRAEISTQPSPSMIIGRLESALASVIS